MPPKLIFICGKAGVGKSTLAKALAQRIDAFYLDKDDIAESLCPNDRETAAYLALHLPIYHALLAVAKANLLLGKSVIIDSPFTGLMGDAGWWESVQALPAKIYTFRIFCDEAENLARLKKRGLQRDLSKIEDYAKSLSQSPLFFEINAPHLDVNSAFAQEENLALMLAYSENETLK